MAGIRPAIQIYVACLPALIASIVDATAQEGVREAILTAYAEVEAASAVAE